MTTDKWVLAWVFLALGGVCTTALAQTPPVVGGVYTCVDAKGRRLTADRPIPECTDREQRQPEAPLRRITRDARPFEMDQDIADKNERKQPEHSGNNNDETHAPSHSVRG